jgi:hypothetical protein
LADSVKAAIANVASVEGKRHSESNRQSAASFCHRHVGSQIGAYELELVDEPDAKHKSGGLYRLNFVSGRDNDGNSDLNSSADADTPDVGIRRASAEASAEASAVNNDLNSQEKSDSRVYAVTGFADDADDSPAHSEKLDSYNLEALETPSASFEAARLQDREIMETAGESSASSAEPSNHIRNRSDNNHLCPADALADALRAPTRPEEHPQKRPDAREEVNRKKSGSKMAGLRAGRVPRPKARPK